MNGEYGWICPKCGKVNAPWVSQCNCNMNTITVGDVPNWTDWDRVKITCNDSSNNEYFGTISSMTIPIENLKVTLLD